MASEYSWGLSPRVRGNQAGYNLLHEREGSIPARAGEPNLADWLRTNARVYPRACGGTAHVAGALTQEMGLSPRVRGNL